MAGRGVSNQHRVEAKDEKVVLEVGLDYGCLAPREYLTRRARQHLVTEKTVLTIFCLKILGAVVHVH